MTPHPDYILSEAEDLGRTRWIAPSKISPWENGVSQRASLTTRQCDELRRLGRDPAQTEWSEGINWMWVVVPVTTPVEGVDRTRHGRIVQRLACPIIRNIGDRIQVLTPKGRLESVYAGGRISPPREVQPKRAGIGR